MLAHHETNSTGGSYWGVVIPNLGAPARPLARFWTVVVRTTDPPSIVRQESLANLDRSGTCHAI